MVPHLRKMQYNLKNSAHTSICAPSRDISSHLAGPRARRDAHIALVKSIATIEVKDSAEQPSPKDDVSEETTS